MISSFAVCETNKRVIFAQPESLKDASLFGPGISIRGPNNKGPNHVLLVLTSLKTKKKFCNLAGALMEDSFEAKKNIHS